MRRRIALAASVLAAVATLCAGGTARADGAGDGVSAGATEGDTKKAYLTLVIDGTPAGDALVEWDPHGKMLIERAALVRAGLRPKGDPSGPSAPLSALGPKATATVDEAALALLVHVPESDLTGTRIDARSSRPAELVSTGAPSLFLNYAPHLVDLSRPSGFAELGAAEGDASITTGANYTDATGPVRGLSAITLDDRKQRIRITIGDTTAGGAPLGGTLVMGGLTIARSFALDPYAPVGPLLTTRGLATTPSTLEIYSGSTLIRREVLPPGPFALENLTVPIGQGAVHAVVRDAFGRASEIGPGMYLGAGLLGRGVTDFAVTAGAPRARLVDRSFAYGSPSLLGRYRTGITQMLTVGARAEADIDTASAGGSIAFALPVGQFEFDGALSHGGMRETGGAAASFGYAFVSPKFSGGLTTRLQSDHYATLSLNADMDRPLVEVATSLGVPIGRRASYGCEFAFGRARDAGVTARVSALTSFQVTPAVTLLGTASRSRYTDGETPIEARLALTIAFDAGVAVTAGATRSGNATAGTLDVMKPLPRGPGVGFRGSTNVGDSAFASGTMEAQTNHIRATATGETAFAGGGVHSDLALAGSVLAVSGEGLFFTRPIEGGAALVHLPEAPHARVLVEEHDVGETDSNGRLLVPDLVAFYGNRIRVDASDLPLELNPEHTAALVAPPARGVAIVRFSAPRASFVRGKVRIRVHGESRVPSYGQILMTPDHGAKFTLPLGEGGEFELDHAPAGPASATVEDEKGGCTFRFTIPASELPVYTMSDVTCETSP